MSDKMKVFDKYIERRREYESGKIALLKGERTSAPERPYPDFQNVSKITEAVNELKEELTTKMSEAFGENGEPKKMSEVKALIRQGEHVSRAIRAEACRKKSFVRRIAAAYGRRMNHVAEGGLIDKMIVDEIEKAITNANK